MATIHDFTARRVATQALAAAHREHWGTEARLTRDPGGSYWLARVTDGHGSPDIIETTLDSVDRFTAQRRAQALGVELLDVLRLTYQEPEQ